MLSAFQIKQYKDNLVDAVYAFLKGQPHNDKSAKEILWILHYCRGQVIGTLAQNQDAALLMCQQKQSIELARQFIKVANLQDIYAQTNSVPDNFSSKLLGELTALESLKHKKPKSKNKKMKAV